MRIAIFGTGGLGGYFGGRLAEAGEEVALIARGEHLKAIRDNGLKVESYTGDEWVSRPAIATDDPSEIGVVDAVMVCTKAWQVAEAAESMRPMVGPETTVVPVQNGVEAPDQLSAALGKDRVIGGVCNIASRIGGPGLIRHTFGVDPNLKLGEMDNSSSSRVEQLKQTFDAATISVEIPDDIQAVMWEKFLLFAPTVGVGCVTRAPTGIWRSVPETMALFEQALDEVNALAQARGVTLTADALDRVRDIVERVPENASTSTQRDVLEGRPSELEFVCGSVIRLGRESGVDTPVNAFLYGSLLPQEKQSRGEITFPPF